MEGHQKIEHSFEAFVGGGFGRLQFQFDTHFGLCVFRWSKPKARHIQVFPKHTCQPWQDASNFKQRNTLLI
jgi:hypothetical protein